MVKDKHSELARGLAPATVPYQMGLISIDRLLGNYSEMDIGAYWPELAERVVESIITGGMRSSEISKLVH